MSQQEFGIKLVKSLLAAPFNSTTIEMVIPATDATALYINDPVKTVTNSDLTGINAGIEYCTKATPTDFLRGIVTSIKPAKEYENIVYRQASTARVVRVCQDPFLLCLAVVNAPVLATDINRFINIDSGGGSNATGNSSIKLDYSTINDLSGQFKIVRIDQILDTYSLVECIIQRHEILSGIVASSDLWNRVAGNLVPATPGDNLDMGTGNISGTDGNFTGDVNIDGKLTVDGLIDPTGLLVSPQTVAPSSDNGLHYYNDTDKRFYFRENSVWNKITISGTTTITFGGIAAGTVLDNMPLYDFLSRASMPYINPSFTAFAISGQSTKEVGAIITGVQTFTWAISDPTHAQANSIAISDEIIPQTLVLGHSIVSPATFDFSTLPGGGVTLSSPGTYTWKVKSIDTGTPPTIFERFFNLQWMWLTHWGSDVNTSLSNAQILALAGSQLRTTFPPQVSFAGGGYFWYWIPSSFAQPTIFKDHATGFAIGMETAVTQSVTNVNGIATNYKGYRSTNTLVSALTIDVT